MKDNLKQIYKKTKTPFILMIINAILLLMFVVLSDNYVNRYFWVLLVSFLILLFLVFLENKFNENKIVKIIVRIFLFPYFLIVSYINVLLIILFFTIVRIFYPNTYLFEYRNYDWINYFPKEIPKYSKDAKYYHAFPFLQGGEEIILYLKLDNESIINYKNEFEKKSIKRHQSMKYTVNYLNTPYEDKATNDLKVFTIESICDDSGYCNHGVDKHVAINEKNNDIIFYYGSW